MASWPWFVTLFDMAPKQTACTYDCPDACSLLVEVNDNRPVVRGDPAQVNGEEGVTVTLPPLSLVSMVLD